MTAQAGRRRADAERNIATIITVAGDLFGRGLSPSMGEVAAAAGVRRATLYGHFPSREELLDAVITHTMTHTDEVLTALALDEHPADVAVELLVRSSWPILDRYRRLRTTALAELGPERLRAHHDRTLHHVERLIRRVWSCRVIRSAFPLPATIPISPRRRGSSPVRSSRPSSPASEVPTVYGG